MKKHSNAASELSPKYVVIGFLYIQPMHGYDLHKHLETNLCEVWHISQSQTYNILKSLIRDNWIAVTLQPQEKRPDKELLSLTDLGRAEFETWLYTPTPGSARTIRVEFISRMFFAASLNENLCSRLIQEQADTIRLDLEKLSKRSSALPADQIFNRMGIDLRIRQLKSVLDWVEDCYHYIEEGGR